MTFSISTNVRYISTCLLLVAVAFSSCTKTTVSKSRAVASAEQKIMEYYGGKDDPKNVWIDIVTRSNMVDYFGNDSTTVSYEIMANIKELNNAGTLKINNVLIPFTGKLHYLFGSEHWSVQNWNGKYLNAVFNSNNQSLVPDFSMDMNAQTRLTGYYWSPDTINNTIDRKKGLIIIWTKDQFSDQAQDAYVVIEGRDYTRGYAVDPFTKVVKDATGTIAISASDLSRFADCLSVNVYLARGQKIDRTINGMSTRFRNISMSSTTLFFR